MKFFLFTGVCVSLLLCATSGFAQETSPNTVTLTVVVTGIENNDGVVMLALCNSEGNYTSEEVPAFQGKNGEIVDKQAIIVFENLPVGEYAIKLFHDENSNGELDINFLGIPKEGYAFSNNVQGSFGAPKYSKTKFEVTADLTITISMVSEE